VAELAADGRARAAALVRALGARVTETLARVVPRGARVALIDFPAHSNVGDSAIWLGELAALDQLGITVGYTSHLRSFNVGGLRAAGRIDAILIHGGGNFGDVWPKHQAHREWVVGAFPELPVVQLPQTIQFQDPAARDRARTALAGHRRFTLLARDATSARTARDELGVRTEQCPDPAFCLGTLEPPARPRHDILALARTDHEQRSGLGKGMDDGVLCVDWLDEPRPPVPWWQSPVEQITGWYPGRLPFLRPLLSSAYTRAAHARVARGCRVLSQARVVVTDRLHAHILSLLLGIPSVLLDNSYGKNRHFYWTWTHEAPTAAWADTPAGALAIARDLLASPSIAP
jgi:exopolysaccharide biosynthesis predicted pyruvyltransferase EpsI